VNVKGIAARGKVLARALASRFTGFSIPIFGVQWNPPVDERKVVRKLIRAVEDRRVLFVPMYLEQPSQVTASVLEIRGLLTSALQDIPDDSAAAAPLRAMRAACRRFLEEPRPDFPHLSHRHWRPDHGRDDGGPAFFVSLGELRATFGFYVATLACGYGIDVEEELASIMPPVDQPG
jgi:hypothetical protein